MIANVFIEMLPGDDVKWERNPDKPNSLRADRILPVRAPYAYGGIVGTVADDGDEIDAFVINDGGVRGVVERHRVLGYFPVRDNGVVDNKYVCHDHDTIALDPLTAIWYYLKAYKPGIVVCPFVWMPPLNESEDDVLPTGEWNDFRI